MDIAARVHHATVAAQEAFWAKVAEQFPEIASGDCSPDASLAFDAACSTAVSVWVESNQLAAERHGKLWWIASNQQEADQWKIDLEAKGATVVKMEAHGNGSQCIDVVFSLVRQRANEILDYQVDGEEWLAE